MFCAIGGTAVWFACFSTENWKFKKKEKNSLAHASTDHAKTKQKNPEKKIFKKSRSQIGYRNSGKSKKGSESDSTNTFWS